jgi:lysophospholipase L1-like esterase
VAALGDSLTDYRSGGGGYLRVLEKRCPESEFVNFGKGGDMVNQMRRRFEAEIASDPAARFTHLVVFGGVNDLYSDETAGRSNAKIERDLSAIYARAHSQGWRVVAVTVAPWGGFSRWFTPKRGAATKDLNAWIEAGPADAVVDAHALLSCGDADRLCPDYAAPFKDGLHFGKKGHEALGEALYRAEFARCR